MWEILCLATRVLNLHNSLADTGSLISCLLLQGCHSPVRVKGNDA